MRILLCLIVSAISLGAFAGSQSSQKYAEDSGVVCVKGKGVGETKEYALKDAFRKAVESAVEMSVDAKLLVDNDELVQDKILTHCNAYIERYEEKKSVKHDDVFEVLILAWVRKGELTRRLASVMPVLTADVSAISKNLYAQIVTRDRREADSESLLKDVFDNFDPLLQLMDVSVVDPPEVSQSKGSPDRKILSYQIKFQIDPDKYFNVWMPHLDDVLSQISLKPGQPFTFRWVRSLSGAWERVKHREYADKCRGDYFAYDKLRFMDASLMGSRRLIFADACGGDDYPHMTSVIAGALDDHDPVASKWLNLLAPVRRWAAFPEMRAKKKMHIALVTDVNNVGCGGVFYELSDQSAMIVSEWISKYSGLTAPRSFDNSAGRSTVYHVLFKDAANKTVASGSCRAFNQDMSNVGSVCWSEDMHYANRNKPERIVPYVLYITPWVGCFADECSTWIDVEITTQDILRISTMSITREPEQHPCTSSKRGLLSRRKQAR